jgi:hemolysin III
LVETTIENTGSEVQAAKPLLRGWSHAVAFCLSLLTGPWVVMQAQGREALTLAVVYALSLTGLLGVSSLYHLVQWNSGPRTWMRRLDHSMIFVLIGGSSTPFALALPPEERAAYLALVWAGCGVGAARSVFWPYAPKWVAAATSLAVAWGIASFVPQMMPKFPAGVAMLVVGGGVTYSLGALCYALKRPNLVRGVFGYHEVFHALVLLAAAMQYVAVRRMLG